jgi:hypothetical protein
MGRDAIQFLQIPGEQVSQQPLLLEFFNSLIPLRPGISEFRAFRIGSDKPWGTEREQAHRNGSRAASQSIRGELV